MEGPEFAISELDELERVVGDATAKPKHITISLLECVTANFSEDRKIGCGGYAVVYLGLLPNGLRIAVRKLHPLHLQGESEFENEVLTLMKISHKNIVRFIGYCSHTQRRAVEFNGTKVLAEISERLMCTEYVPNGSLKEYITGNDGDWNRRYQILKGMCHGLRHLHDELHIIHRDIKTENILLDDNFVPKINDFGLSMHFGSHVNSKIMANNIRGTLSYMAPEAINEGIISVKSDIYSLGVVIIYLVAGERFDWWETNVDEVLELLGEDAGVLALWQSKQIRTCFEIGYNCVDRDPDKRPAIFEILQLLGETESMDSSVSSGHAPPICQSGDEKSDLSDTDTIEPEQESTAEFPPTDEELAELAELDTHGETSTQEHDKPDTVSKLAASAELSKLKFLAEITDEFSHERIVGKDGTFTGSHKAFVYKGDIPQRPIIAVKRLIGVEIPVEKFKREAEQFMSLDHKNIVKVAGYCHDESGGPKLVQFKGRPLPQLFNGPEQLLCYEYVHNGSLREYLAGQGSREIDWHMRYKLIQGTCDGLHYLHKGRGGRPMVHLNLNPSNVLLDENNVPRITGFDFSKLIGEKNTKSMVTKLNGPIAYLPPDFFHSKGTDIKYLATVDIYSLGLMILEMTTRQDIKGNHGMLIKSIEENWREESQIASLYTSLEADKLWQVKLCIDIGLDCVNSKPEKRPTAGNIILWLDKGSKPVPVPRAGAGGVPKPPVHTNITQAHDHIQEKEKRMGFMKRFGWK